MSPKTDLIPSPEDVIAEAPNVDSEDVNKQALRRGKVRELLRMGYNASQISLILAKGIKTAKNEVIHVPSSETAIKRDINYVRQEDASEDVNFSEKRAEVLDKLTFIYQRSINDYLSAKGQARNSFLNTALNVLSKISEIEGVKSPENLNVNLGAEAKISQFSAEIHKLSEDDKLTIISGIRKVLEQREYQGDRSVGVSNEPSGIRPRSSNNEGVSGKRKVRSKTGRPKTSQ